MNRRFLAVVVFALVIALGASYLVYRVLENKVMQNAPIKEVKVVVAARDLPIGTMLKDGDVKLADWPGTLPPQAIVKVEDAINHGVIATIYAGEPVVASRHGSRSRNGGHDSRGHAGGSGAGERCGRRGGLCAAWDEGGSAHFRDTAGG